MNFINKSIGVLTLVLASASTASAFDALYVRQTTGDTKFAIADITEIAFLDEGVSVVTAGGANLYGYDNFCSLRFNQEHTGGVESTFADVNYKFDGSMVAVPGAASIEVYSFDGSKVLGVEGDKADVQLLSAGVYVVKAGNVAFKIVKR